MRDPPAGRTRYPGERILHDVNASRDTGFWFYVADPAGALGEDGSRVCVVGMARRRDGLTVKEAWARGLPHVTVTDALQQPYYVFYPAQCLDNGPALG